MHSQIILIKKEEKKCNNKNPQNVTVGTPIIQIEAKDADTGPNGDVHYRLKQDLAGHWRTFHIDDVTGIISLKLPLDRETQKLYEVIN